MHGALALAAVFVAALAESLALVGTVFPGSTVVFAGGMLIGVAQEWSTLVIDPSLKVAVGFAVLILVLLIRPQGLFGRARSVDR